MKLRIVWLLIVHALSSAVLLAAPVKLLVKNARLFTMAPEQREPFTGYFTVAADGTIVSVAKGDPPQSLKAVQVLDANGDWVIPGFISAHSHLWQAAYRGLAADKTLLAWIDDLYTQRAMKVPAEGFYWFCLLGRSTICNTALPPLMTSLTAEPTSRAVLLMRPNFALSSNRASVLCTAMSLVGWVPGSP